VVASATTTGGTTVTSPNYSYKANTTYLVFVYTSSAAGDSATFTSNINGSPTFNNIGSGSANYNTVDYEFGRWLNTGANPGNNKNITVTFAKTIVRAYIHVVELCGNDMVAPIAQSFYTTSPGTTQTNPYTANLPLAPIGLTNFDVYYLNTQEDLAGNNPTSNPAITLLTPYLHASNGSAATFFANTPSQNESFNKNPIAVAHWGTIAVEIKRP
jgi:hypothetical protein